MPGQLRHWHAGFLRGALDDDSKVDLMLVGDHFLERAAWVGSL